MTSVTTAKKAGLAMFLLAFSQFIITVDYNIVYVALPDIGAALGFSEQYLQWVVSAYAVSFGGLLLFGGRAVDRIGARRILMVGLTCYGVASIAGGFAPDQSVLIAARLVQGVGGALLFPAVLALIATSFAEGRERTKAFAMWAMTGSLGLAAGALLGGVLTDLASWRWVFLINVPLVLIILIPAPKVLRPDGAVKGTAGFDLPGAILATVGVSALVTGLVSGPDLGWTSTFVVTALLLAVTLLIAFFVTEARSRNPLMPMRMFTNRPLVIAMSVLLVFQTALSGGYYVFTTYVQPVLGYTAFQAGLAFLPLTLLSMIGSGKLGPLFMERFGMRITLFLGMIINGLGIGLTAAVMTVGGSFYALLPGSVLWGIGGGLVFISVFATAGSGVPADEQGVAGAMASTAQQVGGAVGLAVLVAVANSTFSGTYLAAAPADVASGLRLAGIIGGAMLIVGGFLALAMRKQPVVRERPAQPAEPAEPESAAALN